MSNKFRKLKWKILFFVLVCSAGAAVFLGWEYMQKSDAKKVAASIHSSCFSNIRRDECYSKNFFNLTKTGSFTFSRKVLSELETIDSTVKDCHFIAHQIALAEVIKKPERWMNLFEEFSPQECSRGYMHGIIEGHQRADPSFKINSVTISEICTDIEMFYSEAGSYDIFRNCVHTMGHLLLVQERGNVEGAVNLCLGMEEKIRYPCSFGVFMENLQRQNLQAHGIPGRTAFNSSAKEAEIKRCKGYSALAADACWENISWLFNKINNYDPEKLIDDCRNAQSESALSKCYSWGSNVIALYRLSGQLEEKDIDGICDALNFQEGIFNECIEKTVYYLIVANKSMQPYVWDFCSKLQGSSREVCFKQLETSLKDSIGLEELPPED
jgi:hypothetical protein